MIKLLHGNCLDFLANMDDSDEGLVITSPPYNMNLRIKYGKYLFRSEESKISTKYRSKFEDKMTMEDYYDFHKRVLEHLIRVSRIVFYNTGFFTGNKVATFELIGHFSKYLKDIIVWDKGNAQPAMGNGVMNSQYEVILIFEDGNAISRQFKEANFNRGELSNLWVIPRQQSKDKLHAAVFPEKLVETIIDNFHINNELIIDPFMGTGTTGVIAKRYGIDFLGIELDEMFYRNSQMRIEETMGPDDYL